MDSIWNNIRFFTPKEFDSPDLKDSGYNMNPEFMEILDGIRKKCSFPFKINSGFRTEEHNKLVGGKESSAHTKGLAADIECKDSNERITIVKTALNIGITRIGIAKNFIHLDMDYNLPQQVMWLY